MVQGQVIFFAQGLWRKYVRGECKTSLHDYFTKPQSFYAKSVELEVIFNRCWVFRDAKCGIYKPKWGIYKPYWAVRRIRRNFAASLWASARIDCEVDASFYEVGLHGWWRGINFAASMSAGRTYRYSLSIIHFSRVCA